ncbi:hypothetical protein [Cupriavidus basilensis]|uniref:hypothetical protein n=1 Tax=Cupriavidus basilensis TaxID=68895 RepID=UPI0020A6692F|nr:hypothetical protein [Cupriavidus basilensis]MCP3017986.1 hypothetical protein [Cupriavidus basilensis]
MSNTTKSSTGTEVLGHIFSVLFCLTALTILKGWALSVVWAWFIVPTFALPALTIPQAIGISIVAALIKPGNIESQNKNGIWLYSVKVSSLIGIATLIAWVVSKFM